MDPLKPHGLKIIILKSRFSIFRVNIQLQVAVTYQAPQKIDKMTRNDHLHVNNNATLSYNLPLH